MDLSYRLPLPKQACLCTNFLLFPWKEAHLNLEQREETKQPRKSNYTLFILPLYITS